jgi:hypothetical protein
MLKFCLGALPALAVTSLAVAQEHTVQTTDAYRFIEVFETADGLPTAEALQAGYLDGAGRGVEIFTPNRIRNAEHLAATIARDPDVYRRAIDVCLPLAEAASADLNTIYTAMSEMFPDYDMPAIHVVFGARNSGGTAGPDAQVLGLEILCEVGESDAEIERIYRHFFAHETVHVFQHASAAAAVQNPLLVQTLREGFADYVSWRITGAIPTQGRNDWALENEDMVWAEFAADLASIDGALEAGASMDAPSEEMLTTYHRWHANFRNAPEGWPSELGYWVGRQIITRFIANSEDPEAAFEAALRLDDPMAVLTESGVPTISSSD